MIYHYLAGESDLDIWI